MSLTKSRSIRGAFAILLLVPSIGLAQSTFGSISGVVADATGAIVPKAQITITNTRTGAVRETVNTAAGVYNMPNLDVGTYTLRVSASGFSTFERSQLTLVSNQVLNINVELAVGATSCVVEVKGTSPTITTESN